MLQCCPSCASLLQTRDKAAKELDVTSKTLFTYLKTSSTIRAIGSNKAFSANDDADKNLLDTSE